MLQQPGAPIQPPFSPRPILQEELRTDMPPAVAVLPPQGGAFSQITTNELAFRVVANFRGHPHISNVLTHISGGNWTRVEQALRTILDPVAGSCNLSPLARNIIDLMCADRGVTGRIMKPYFHGLLNTVLEPRSAARMARHVTALFLELGSKAQRPESAALAASERPTREPN